MLDGLKATLINTVYPPRCLACTEATDQPHGLCPACWRDTHFIAGTACRSAACRWSATAGAEDVCESCARHPPAWDRGAAAFLYAGAGRRMVLALKHGDRLDMVRPLAGWMAARRADAAGRGRPVAPVPLHWRRLVRRRYNQSAELARRLGRIAGRPVRPGSPGPAAGDHAAGGDEPRRRGRRTRRAPSRSTRGTRRRSRAGGAAGRRRAYLGRDALGLRRLPARGRRGAGRRAGAGPRCLRGFARPIVGGPGPR